MYIQGQRDLNVWAGVEADGSTQTKTPSKVKTIENSESTRLIKLAEKHKDGHIPKVDWMDRLVFRYIMKLCIRLVNNNNL